MDSKMSSVQTDGNKRTSIILVKFGWRSYPHATGIMVSHLFQSIGLVSYTQSLENLDVYKVFQSPPAS